MRPMLTVPQPTANSPGVMPTGITHRPAWLITIDTEGDNLWAAPRQITTRNSQYLERFQSLCERFELKPTYLTNWEMAHCPVFVEFARDFIARGAGEIGMHLHAWNNPPLVPLTEDDYHYRPYLMEYPLPVMRDKIARLTDVLRSTFDNPVVSHRAGRWALNGTYARLLIEHGYRIDCSMTPHVTWHGNPGAPQGRGGVDYRSVSEHAFWIDMDDIRCAGESPLLEIPMSIRPGPHHRMARFARQSLTRWPLGRRIAERLYPSVQWFRPNRRNARSMQQMLVQSRRRQEDYIEMMLHSSELMPGGSPYFPDERAIERLYEDLEKLFESGHGYFQGMTLRQYHTRFTQRAAAGLSQDALQPDRETQG